MSSPERQIVQAVREKGHILLATHFNPDGDALGSLLGLAEILEGMGKRVLRFLEDPVIHLYRFLPGSGGLSGMQETIFWHSAWIAATSIASVGIARNW